MDNETKTSPADNPGWIGEQRELVYALKTFGADTDEDGLVKIFGAPIVMGLDGSVVVPGECECEIGGKRANVAALLRQTSYGLSVVVF